MSSSAVDLSHSLTCHFRYGAAVHRAGGADKRKLSLEFQEVTLQRLAEYVVLATCCWFNYSILFTQGMWPGGPTTFRGDPGVRKKGIRGPAPGNKKLYLQNMCKTNTYLGFILDVLRFCHSLGLQGDCFKTDCFFSFETQRFIKIL